MLAVVVKVAFTFIMAKGGDGGGGCCCCCWYGGCFVINAVASATSKAKDSHSFLNLLEILHIHQRLHLFTKFLLLNSALLSLLTVKTRLKARKHLHVQNNLLRISQHLEEENF